MGSTGIFLLISISSGLFSSVYRSEDSRTFCMSHYKGIQRRKFFFFFHRASASTSQRAGHTGKMAFLVFLLLEGLNLDTLQ